MEPIGILFLFLTTKTTRTVLFSGVDDYGFTGMSVCGHEPTVVVVDDKPMEEWIFFLFGWLVPQLQTLLNIETIE
jgi:hypothetical protein